MDVGIYVYMYCVTTLQLYQQGLQFKFMYVCIYVCTSSGWLNQLTKVAVRYLVKSAIDNIDNGGGIGLPSSTADSIGSDSHQQQHIHRAMAANSSPPLLSSSHSKAMLVMSDRSGKM